MFIGRGYRCIRLLRYEFGEVFSLGDYAGYQEPIDVYTGVDLCTRRVLEPRKPVTVCRLFCEFVVLDFRRAINSNQFERAKLRNSKFNLFATEVTGVYVIHASKRYSRKKRSIDK